MWGLFDTQFDTRSRAGRRVKKIWIDAETLSERVQERDLFRLVILTVEKTDRQYKVMHTAA